MGKPKTYKAMKNFIKILVILGMMKGFGMFATNTNVDFNFPQQVKQAAIKDLSNAEKKGDTQKIVDALVRYSIAQGNVSEKNIKDIVNQIANVRDKSKDPVCRSLLYYFEAKVYYDYADEFSRWGRVNPDVELPDDVSEWDRRQFGTKINSLIEQAIVEPQVLIDAPIADYKLIVEQEPDAPLYEPNLMVFVARRSLEMVNMGAEGDMELRDKLNNLWATAVEGNVPAMIYRYSEVNDSRSAENTRKLYNQFYDNEHSGLLLSSLTDNDDYDLLKGYLKRFPNGKYSADIQNNINSIESRRVWLYAQSDLSSQSEIKVQVNVRNVNNVRVTLYRLNDKDALSLNSSSTYEGFQLSKFDVVCVKETSVEGVIPFTTKVDVSFPAQKPGMYALQAEYADSDGNIVRDNESVIARSRLLRVHDVYMFLVEKRKESQLIAVDLHSGAPLAGVEIVEKKDKRFLGLTKRLLGHTNSNGIFPIPIKNDYMTLIGTTKSDPYGMSLTANKFYSLGDNRSMYIKVFTDLGVYRPGETVKFALISYCESSKALEVSPKEKLTVGFFDPNGREIESRQVTTDSLGRADGEFTIPTNRLNGSFSIRVKRKNDARGNVGYKAVNVSEYKMPTFFVDISESRKEWNRGDAVTLEGKVETYSGLPVAGVDVVVKLKKGTWWWRPVNIRDAVRDDTVKTDAQGRFSVFYPSELVNSEEDRYARYEVEVICTNAAGETHDCHGGFSLGNARGIQLTKKSITLVNDKAVELPVTFNTTYPDEKDVKCRYELLHGDVVVAQGDFLSDNSTVDLTAVKSGEYRLKVGVVDDPSAMGDEGDIVLYKSTDKECPVKDKLMWIPTTGRNVDDKNVARILVGTNLPETHIYYVASSRNKVEKEGWVKFPAGLNTLQLQVPDGDEEFLTVTLFAVGNDNSESETLTLNSEVNRREINVQVSSFRDRLVPGDREKWTFKMTDKEGRPVKGALMLELINKAVDDIASNHWYFSPRFHNPTNFNIKSNHYGLQYFFSLNWRREGIYSGGYEQARLYMYDMSVFSSMRVRELAAMPMYSYASTSSARMFKSNSIVASMDSGEVDIAEDEVVAEAKGEEVQAALNEVAVRDVDVKTALWNPMLTTDENGNVSVEFEAPQTNSTWIMQALGYTPNILLTDIVTREMVTQKPVMVKPSLPRFVRQGDNATLSATVQNATDEEQQYNAVIELFDPRTEQIILTRNFEGTIAARGTEAISIMWNPDETLGNVGFRVKAVSGNCGDGEQTMLPILTSIQPVIETQPFYADAGTETITVNLPQFKDDARVTFEFCNDPVWYCVTALPTIYNEQSQVSTSIAFNLWALRVAQGVANMRPDIKQAVSYWLENKKDSTLVSMLERNGDLKIGTLLASPWVSAAESQTMRMQHLNNLFNEEFIANSTDLALNKLKDLQNSDGGWVWFRYPNAKSSLMTTETILQLLGELKRMNYIDLTDRLTKMLEAGVQYMDIENLKLYKKQLKENKNNHSGFDDYVFIRSFYPEIPVPAENRKMIKNCVKAMTSDWKGTSIGDKAYYAIALYRNAHKKEAKKIIESIRQYAITEAHSGMYWENLNRGVGRWYDKLAVTALVLEAMNEIDPRVEEIDQVRKWILLNKESNDWGGSSLAADAVYAMLATGGSDWLVKSETPEVTINGRTLDIDDADAYLGYFRRDIKAESGAQILIKRSGDSPAWGSVYNQYRASMTDIEEVKIDDLSINKEYYKYAEGGKLVPVTTFAVGDKIQVRMVIKVGKDLDFVTVKDERGSCFEPVDELSGYRFSGEAFYYLETKDSTTNVFFNSLNRGTTIIGYDVYVTAAGSYNAGIASAQCQYAPQIAAHSAGKQITVTEKP